MAKFPFQLLIKCVWPEKRTEILSCTALLRVIPGRRQVYEAKWGDRSVIVKVFSHYISAKRHLKREWQGLSELARRQVSSPAPLFYGRIENGPWAIVVEKIADSSTALDVFNKTTEKTGKLDLLVLVCKELAKQHQRGILQKDLHLGNFLLKEGKLFALDPAQIRLFPTEITRKRSISQLALLACLLPESDTDSITQLCQEYFKARGWRLAASDKALFQKQLIMHRKRGVKYGLKKCLRTSRRHLRLKIRNSIAVFDRDFCLGAEPLDFMGQIDALMDKGLILKNGNTSYVSHLSFNGKDVVVKRHNHKGFVHSLRHTIKKSRARQGWLHAHWLRMLQIPTPKPLAYIEKRRGFLLWQSYLVTEYVEGQKLYDFLRDSKTNEQKRSMVTQQIAELLERLGKYRISHGDLKHSNILVTDNGLMITDLDGMKVHKWIWMYKVRKAKDLANLQIGDALSVPLGQTQEFLRNKQT
ncbi:MAG: lipopolysaccharide kinase InaA family protein [Sedimentisphaerales bacterium]